MHSRFGCGTRATRRREQRKASPSRSFQHSFQFYRSWMLRACGHACICVCMTQTSVRVGVVQGSCGVLRSDLERQFLGRCYPRNAFEDFPRVSRSMSLISVQMDEIYASVCKTKQLPDIVEALGRKGGGKDAQDIQTNVRLLQQAMSFSACVMKRCFR